MSDQRDPEEEREPEEEEGQVSEVAGLDPEEAGTPISPGDATEGYPGGESGEPDEPAEAGPNAVPEANAEGNEYDRD